MNGGGRRRFLRRLAALALASAAAALALAVAAAAVAWALVDWPVAESRTYPGGVVLRDASGRAMRVSLGAGGEDFRPGYEADPGDWIVKAVVAAEDGEFWRHRGVRPMSVLRAVWQNAVCGRRVSGASTITMQAVRLMRPHRKTYFAKWLEAVRAVKMERARDKRWIVTQYLNRAPFGSNLVGVEAAAQGWFGKRAKDLGLGEAACLAGMVQAPSRLRVDRWPDRAARRRDYVLGRMVALGMVDAERARSAAAVKLVARRAARPFRCAHYCDWALARLGAGAYGGADVRTALDAEVQARCEEAVAALAADTGRNAAAVAMRVATGEVVAMACSGDYFRDGDGKVNTAASARPAGSTLKPFLAALALDRGVMAPTERLADVPQVYAGYAPANFDGGCRGEVTLRDSLVLSLNLPFVDLLRRVGVDEFASALAGLGIGRMADRAREYGLGLAIGNAEVSPLELAGAYGALARGGVWLEPTPFAAASAGGGAGRRVFSEGAAYMVSQMLAGDERSEASLGHVADVSIARFAWKTGTSAGNRDAWTVAWNPEWVVAVWCGSCRGGFGDGALTGAGTAAPTCWRIARGLYPRGDGPWFAAPATVGWRRVCAQTGRLAGPDCPRTEDGWYLSDRTPALVCGGHGRGAEPGRRARLAIASPVAGGEYRRVRGAVRQGIVCRASGADGELWWFVDGALAGRSAGSGSLVVAVSAGEHEIRCADSAGGSAAVKVKYVAD